ncbi:hypothetical protein D3C86_1939940 [compost metagenome]
MQFTVVQLMFSLEKWRREVSNTFDFPRRGKFGKVVSFKNCRFTYHFSARNKFRKLIDDISAVRVTNQMKMNFLISPKTIGSQHHIQ